MRGARIDTIHSGTDGRIIPADAGSTEGDSQIAVSAGDHPRGCGEHVTVDSRSAPIMGSSPRMRGAHQRRILPFPSHRIIPADAGSTSLLSACHVPGWDHPRGCGEHML